MEGMVDLTPEAARTEEGQRRIRAAMEAQEAAILRCANMLDHIQDAGVVALMRYFAKPLEHKVRHGLDNEEFAELADAVDEAIKARRAADNTLLAAISGREAHV